VPEAVEGLRALNKKLERLEQAVAVKAMRASVMAATKPVIAEMKAAVPRGDRPHKTYKGRTVGGGFLSRSIIRKSRYNKQAGTISVAIGVKGEAFYGVSFVDRGTKKMTGRRWFLDRFIKNKNKMVGVLKQKLAEKIKAATV